MGKLHRDQFLEHPPNGGFSTEFFPKCLECLCLGVIVLCRDVRFFVAQNHQLGRECRITRGFRTVSCFNLSIVVVDQGCSFMP